MHPAFNQPDVFPKIEIGTIRTWNWKKIRRILGHVGLLLAFTIYTIIGAVIFRELERTPELDRIKQLIQNLEDQRQRVIKSSAWCGERTSECQQILDDYETAISEACQGGVEVPVKISDEINSNWDFPQAAFFASTVVTTIGYGNTVPKTFGGRLFCMFFAIIGIPLTLSLIADVGFLLATGVSSLHAKLKSYLPQKIAERRLRVSVQRWLFVLGGIAFLFFYLAAGGLIFMILDQDWGFFESFYFCFITMTTIGFGDYVPVSPNYMFMCMLYILVGLALTSTIIELVRRQYISSWRALQALSGPLAESLRRLGETTGADIDIDVLQNDLRKILAVMSFPRRTDDGKQWQGTIDSTLRDIGIRSPTTRRSPQVLQIVVYETTV